METCKEWMDDTSVKCAYLAIVLVLVLLIFMQVRKMGFYYERFQGSWQAGDPELVEFRTGHGYVRNVLPRVGIMGGSAVGLQTFSDTSQLPPEHGFIERD